MARNQILEGNCLEVMREIPDNSIDAVITDPPYGLSFMGKKWDYDVPSVEIWSECLRVLKPGGYLLAFAGTRTQHRMAVRIEDAGFEIRDMIAWIYGSGFPKSLNIGKAVDKIQGNEREVMGKMPKGYAGLKRNANLTDDNWKGITEEDTGLEVTKGTSEWEGWGTALKPALEPITVARKPLSEKTVALNCLKWGVGGIDIDGCRVETNPDVDDPRLGGKGNWHIKRKPDGHTVSFPAQDMGSSTLGRFPANLIHDGSVEVLSLFPNTGGGKYKSGAIRQPRLGREQYGDMEQSHDGIDNYGNFGSAARFFYCAKASKSERNINGANNNHATVKPIKLMEYLVKLVSREGALVLDPFAGSGSTGIACQNLNRNFILIEREPEYIKIIKDRIKIWQECI